MIFSRIIGTGSYLPEKIVTNADLEKVLDTTDQWIRERTGICERRDVNNIEDRGDNATRFLVIGRELLTASGQDKTTILVSASHTDGAGVLHSLLQPLATHGISMSRIESRPSRRKNWDYVFFIDLDGHAEEAPLIEALEELEKRSSLFRVLGAYPTAIN